MCMLQIICNQKFPAMETPSVVCVCGGGVAQPLAIYLTHYLYLYLSVWFWG